MRAFGGGQRAVTSLSSEWDSASSLSPMLPPSLLAGQCYLFFFFFFCRGKPIAEKLSSTPRITQLLSDQLSEISFPSWRKEDWVPHLTEAAGNQSPVGNASSQIMMPSGRSQTFLRWVGRRGGTGGNRARGRTRSGGVESCAVVSAVGFPSTWHLSAGLVVPWPAV